MTLSTAKVGASVKFMFGNRTTTFTAVAFSHERRPPPANCELSGTTTPNAQDPEGYGCSFCAGLETPDAVRKEVRVSTRSRRIGKAYVTDDVFSLNLRGCWFRQLKS